MGTSVKKDTFIKIRVTTEQKELYKEYAEAKHITLTELICNSLDNLIEKDRLKSKEIEMLEPRLDKLEKEIMKVKKKMLKRSCKNVSLFKLIKLKWVHSR